MPMIPAAVLAALALALWAIPGGAAMNEKEKADLAPVVTAAKVTLEQGLLTSKKNGKPQLSVYTVKDGTKYSEVIIDHTSGEIAKTEPITGGDDLAAAKKQADALFRATRELREAVKEAKRDNPGYQAVSVWSEMKGGHSIATVTLVKDNDWKTVVNDLTVEKGDGDGRPHPLLGVCCRIDGCPGPAGGGADRRRHRAGQAALPGEGGVRSLPWLVRRRRRRPAFARQGCQFARNQARPRSAGRDHPLRRARRHRDAAFRQVRLDRGRELLRHDRCRCWRQKADGADRRAVEARDRSDRRLSRGQGDRQRPAHRRRLRGVFRCGQPALQADGRRQTPVAALEWPGRRRFTSSNAARCN